MELDVAARREEKNDGQIRSGITVAAPLRMADRTAGDWCYRFEEDGR